MAPPRIPYVLCIAAVHFLVALYTLFIRFDIDIRGRMRFAYEFSTGRHFILHTKPFGLRFERNPMPDGPATQREFYKTHHNNNTS